MNHKSSSRRPRASGPQRSLLWLIFSVVCYVFVAGYEGVILTTLSGIGVAIVAVAYGCYAYACGVWAGMERVADDEALRWSRIVRDENRNALVRYALRTLETAGEDDPAKWN